MRFSPKPDWIKVRLPGGPVYSRISKSLKERNLHTVCEEAKCPNLGECWGSGTATIMLLGETCTRGCRFCAVKSGNPNLALDPHEPRKAAETVELMGLEYVVLTSVNRDDLPDGGSGQIARTIREIRTRTPSVWIEVLIPDFQGSATALRNVIDAGPHVLAHNLETVDRLTPHVRDARASYAQSLEVLATIRSESPGLFTKSSIMLGLGETRDELLRAFEDLRSVGVQFLTLGQYLQPTQKHIRVERFLTPDEFKELEVLALGYGFEYVASGPLVRSSYKAGEFFIASRLRARAASNPQFPTTKGVEHGV